VVISMTPANFTFLDFNKYWYVGNFQLFHANGLIFNPYLSMELKSVAAQRLLDYTPKILQSDPVLLFALKDLINLSIQSRALYVIILPLGEFQTEAMWLQDHVEVILYIRSHQIAPNVQHIPREIDWAKFYSDALTEEKLHTLSNPYGIEDSTWKKMQAASKLPLPLGSDDASYLQFEQNAIEWTDFKILLDVLQELGAKPLILSRPMNYRLWEALGVSESAQNSYYTKLHNVVDPYHVTLEDFHQYSTDIYFSTDQTGHPSRYGWVYVDQTLDQFFHNTLH